jgi:hypothetical protein
MAFITDGGGNVVSFAEYTDILQKDQRLLESNIIKIPAESGFNDVTDFLEDVLEKSTDRILLKLKASTWWQSYNAYVGNPISNLNSLPNVNPNLIDPGDKLNRRQQFTDLCVYYAFAQYVLPLIADFGNPESEEVSKITYYDAKFNDLFNELIAIADWYDYDNSGTVDADEKAITYARTRRTRSRRSIVQVR